MTMLLPSGVAVLPFGVADVAEDGLFFSQAQLPIDADDGEPSKALRALASTNFAAVSWLMPAFAF